MTAQPLSRRGATCELQRGYRIMIPAILAVGIFAIVPLAGMFALTFSDYNLIRRTNWDFGFHSFGKMLADNSLKHFPMIFVTTKGRAGAINAGDEFLCLCADLSGLQRGLWRRNRGDAVLDGGPH